MKSSHHMVASDTGGLGGVFVTVTGVGKTWVAALARLRARHGRERPAAPERGRAVR